MQKHVTRLVTQLRTKQKGRPLFPAHENVAAFPFISFPLSSRPPGYIYAFSFKHFAIRTVIKSPLNLLCPKSQRKMEFFAFFPCVFSLYSAGRSSVIFIFSHRGINRLFDVKTWDAIFLFCNFILNTQALYIWNIINNDIRFVPVPYWDIIQRTVLQRIIFINNIKILWLIVIYLYFCMYYILFFLLEIKLKFNDDMIKLNVYRLLIAVRKYIFVSVTKYVFKPLWISQIHEIDKCI